MQFRHGKVPRRRGYRKRPEFIEALSAMEVLEVLVWDFMSAADFHLAIRNQPAVEGMRFRTFKDVYKGKQQLFVVRVH